MFSRRRNTGERYRLPSSSSLDEDPEQPEPAVDLGMAQSQPPHVAEAHVVGIYGRHLDPKSCHKLRGNTIHYWPHPAGMDACQLFVTPTTKQKLCGDGISEALEKYVFRVDLTWSDGHKTTSFRSYSEFFDLQCELLVKFPQEAGEKKSTERTLPYLPGKQIFRRSTRQLAEERLPKINNYISELLKLPAHISQCEKVLRFFRSNWQEDRIRCDEGHGALSRDNSSTSIKYTVKHLSNSRPPISTSSSTEELLNGVDEQRSNSTSERLFALNGEFEQQTSVASDDDSQGRLTTI